MRPDYLAFSAALIYIFAEICWDWVFIAPAICRLLTLLWDNLSNCCSLLIRVEAVSAVTCPGHQTAQLLDEFSVCGGGVFFFGFFFELVIETFFPSFNLLPTQENKAGGGNRNKANGD